MPTLDFALKVAGSTARLREAGLVDTGSHVTVMSEKLLRLSGFPVERARKTAHGIEGLGGHEDLFILPNAVVALEDAARGLHPVNLPGIHFVRHDLPPILGRDVMEALSATLRIDFHAKSGSLDLG